MLLGPLRHRADTALLTQHGTRTDAQDERPCELFAAGVARVRDGAQCLKHSALLLLLVHCRAPCEG